MKRVIVVIVLFMHGNFYAAQNGVPMDTDQKSVAAAMQTDAEQKAVVAANGMQTEGERKAEADKKQIHYFKDTFKWFENTDDERNDDERNKVIALIKKAIRSGIHPDLCKIKTDALSNNILVFAMMDANDPGFLYFLLRNGAKSWSVDEFADEFARKVKDNVETRMKQHQFSLIVSPVHAHMLYQFGVIPSFKHGLANTNFLAGITEEYSKFIETMAKMPLFFYMHGSDPLEIGQQWPGESEKPLTALENITETLLFCGIPELVEYDDGTQAAENYRRIFNQMISRLIRLGVPLEYAGRSFRDQLKKTLKIELESDIESDNEMALDLFEIIEDAEDELKETRKQAAQKITEFIRIPGVVSIVIDYLDNHIQCPSITREITALQNELDMHLKVCELQYNAEERIHNAANGIVQPNAEPELDLSLLPQSNDDSQSASSSNSARMEPQAGSKRSGDPLEKNEPSKKPKN